MVWIVVKVFFMTTLSMVAFLCNPMAFPFVLMTAFLLWSTPYVIAAFVADDVPKKGAVEAETAT